MHRLPKIAFAAAVVFMMAGSAVHATNSALTGIKTVAIISVLGPLHLENNGGLFSRPTDTEVPIENWGVDERVHKIAEDNIGPRFQVVAAPLDPAALVNCSRVAPCTLSLPKSSLADAYVVISASHSIGMKSSQLMERYRLVSRFGSGSPF